MIFGQKNPIFPYIFSMAAPWSDNFEVFACKGAYKKPQAFTVVIYVLTVSTITTSINGIL